MSRPAVEVADILHAQGHTFLEQHPWLSVQQRTVLRAIARCRTAALGGHLDRCDACGHQAISYNSCRNRHCPKFQAQARERWLHAREAAHIPDRCPAVILRRVGGLGTESQGGVVLALWESGAMLRAESSKRPFGSHVLGYIERVDVTRILGIVKQSPLWTMRSQGLAVDMPSDELELQQAEGRIS